MMPSLTLYMECRRWGVLPSAGGLFDQDPDVMRDLAVIASVVEEHEVVEDSRRR